MFQTYTCQVQYSDKNSFTAADRNGRDDTGWYSEKKNQSRSIRIILDGNPLPNNSIISVSFPAKVNGVPPSGQVAYNGFSYCYFIKTNDPGVTASTQVVGVEVPYYPTLQKTVVDRNGNEKQLTSDQDFYFLIYQGAKITFTPPVFEANGTLTTYTASALESRAYKTVTLTVKKSQSIASMDLKEFGTFWQKDQEYTVVEQAAAQDRFRLISWVLTKSGGFTTYHVANGQEQYTMKYTNAAVQTLNAKNRDSLWDLKVRKVSSKTLAPLRNAVFGIYSPDKNNKTTNTLLTETYSSILEYTAIRNNKEETWYLIDVITSDQDGMVVLPDRTEDMYMVLEIKPPEGYYAPETPYWFIQPNNPIEWIKNTPGVELPATGGAGTGTYTAAGGALALLALALLILRRRKAKTQA